MVATNTGRQRNESGPAPAIETSSSDAATADNSISVYTFDETEELLRPFQYMNASAPIEKPNRQRMSAPSKQTSKYLSLVRKSIGGAAIINVTSNQGSSLPENLHRKAKIR